MAWITLCFALCVVGSTLVVTDSSNPCSGWGVCSQLCRHDIVSHIHHCDCLPGYVLERDSYTCSPNDSITNYILFTSGRESGKENGDNEIRRLDLKQQTSVSLVSAVSWLFGMDFVYNRTAGGGNGDHSLVFWTDDYGREIYRGKLISNLITNVQLVLTASASSIAVDWITQHLYWTEKNLNQIEVAAFDGTQRITLVAGSIEEPRAIVVDPRHGILFWADWSASYRRIEKMSMSGRGREVIFNVQGGGRPYGLTVDYEATRLYWIDDFAKSIHTVLYDGSDHHTVLHDRGFITDPIAISVFGNHVYWAEYEKGLLFRANKWTGDHVEVIQKTPKPKNLKVFHPKRQPIVSNPCEKDNGVCHGDAICLLGYNRTAECRCPHLKQLALDNRSCEYDAVSGTDTTNKASTARPDAEVTTAGKILSDEASTARPDAEVTTAEKILSDEASTARPNAEVTTAEKILSDKKCTGSSSSNVLVATLAGAVVLLIVIVVVVVTLLISQRKRLTAQQESKKPLTHSLQSLHHSEPHTQAEVEAIVV